MKKSTQILVACFTATIYVWFYRRQIIRQPSNSLYSVNLSILIPVYNVEQFLSKCLKTIQYQTFHDFEVIIVDDGSSDRSGAIADHFSEKDKRFCVIHNTNNTGLLLARKKAVQQAKGQYCIFLDSDDYLTSKDSLRYIIQLLQQSPVDIMQFSVKVVGGTQADRKRMTDYLHVYEGTIEGGTNILRSCFLDHMFSTTLWSKIYNMKVVKKVYDSLPNTHLVIAEDICTSFLLQVHSHSFRGVQTKPIYSYRIGTGVSTQKMTLQTLKAFLHGECQALNIIYQLMPSDHIIECREAYNSLFKLFFESQIARVSLIHQKDRIEAIESMLYYYPPFLLSQTFGDGFGTIVQELNCTESWISHLSHLPDIGIKCLNDDG